MSERTTIIVTEYVEGSDDRDISSALGRVGQHWGLFLSFGLISILLGVAMMVWPQVTVGVVALLLGVSLIVSGVFGLVASFSEHEEQTSSRVLTGISGALSILLGVLCFRGVFQAVEILALFVGIGWLMRGIFDLVAGLQAKGRPGRGWVITVGILGIIAGVVVLVWPAPTLTVLAWIGGLWLVLLGIVQVIAAFSLRKVGQGAAA